MDYRTVQNKEGLEVNKLSQTPPPTATAITHAINEEVQVVGDHTLSIQQASLTLSMPITPRSRLQTHHPLEDSILILVQKVGQLGRIDRRVQLQERPHGRYAQLDLDVGEEQLGLSDQGVLRRLGDPSR